MVVIILKSLLEVACTKNKGVDIVLMHTLVFNVILFTAIQCFLLFTCVMELMAYSLELIYLAQFAWIDSFWNIWQNSCYQNNAA